MTSAATRQRLLTYLSDAEEDKVKSLYTLLEKDILAEGSFSLSQEHLDVLEKQRELHTSGQTKSYN